MEQCAVVSCGNRALGEPSVAPRHIQRVSFGNKKRTLLSSSCFRNGERCREPVDAADEMTRRLYNVIDWMFEYPDYNPKTKVIPKNDYPVLVDVTF